MQTELSHPAPLAAMEADFSAKLRRLGVDERAEEYNLQRITQELTNFARASGPSASIQLVNTELETSATAWQALISDFPERSFRGDFNRVLRRSVGILAGIQEEAFLYSSRTERALHRKRVERFLYLAKAATQVLRELVEMESQARTRGLTNKADHAQNIIERLWQGCELANQIDVESLL